MYNQELQQVKNHFKRWQEAFVKFGYRATSTQKLKRIFESSFSALQARYPDQVTSRHVITQIFQESLF